MTFRRGQSGFPISDDPTEVNPTCLILKEMGHLKDCPEWLICRCAVCAQAREDEAQARETASSPGHNAPEPVP